MIKYSQQDLEYWKETATTIYSQLGGSANFPFEHNIAFNGGSDQMGRLVIEIPPDVQLERPCNLIFIDLAANDTYTVSTLSKNNHEACDLIATQDHVYCDELAQVFENLTGLQLQSWPAFG